ncbi:WD40 domain-containing protein [Lyngbya aestuarii]|uniref:WD40 domain-containing protein n=1 Tax=Lyngbya aestuarii TaxID=118322 RepID=UPI00403D80F7
MNDNHNSLNTLLRAISWSGGSFSLILARCNYSKLREKIVTQLQEQPDLEIRQLVLDKSSKTLSAAIEKVLNQKQPNALIISGLESVNELEQLLSATNQMREEFRHLTFPLVLWVTDEVLQKLIRLAPDFEGWSTAVDFTLTTDELINFIEQSTNQVFSKVLDAGASIFLDNVALSLDNSFPSHAELESAQTELQHRGVSLEPELEACLEFVLGRDVSSSPKHSRRHYERSLALWQPSYNLERHGCIFFYLGLWWLTYLLGHRHEYEQACHRAKSYFERTVEVFEQANRPDLVAKFINALGDSLQRLKRWDELEIVAHKALELHQIYSDQFRLARVHGFFAEVALGKSDWNQAKESALRALWLLATAEANSWEDFSEEQRAKLDWERSFHQGWYLFSLAKAYSSLSQVPEALNTLISAKAQTKSQYDPELYIQILEELRVLYFQQGDYLKAFETKQERRVVEHQYGFRAFIGAGRLQPKQQVTNPVLPSIQQQGTVAPEIAASGRQQEVNRLVERLGRDDYKLTVIHGQSGVGKSSLVQAGLIPALKQKPLGSREVLPVLQQVYTDWPRKLGECLVQALAQMPNCTSYQAVATEALHQQVSSLSCSFANMPEPVILDSTAALLQQLQINAENNLLTVLIFDQFEEFFFIYKEPSQRRVFYEFLRSCLNISYVKVILSLREDYLSYLLEWNRYTNLDVVNNDILNKDILFYFGNFSEQAAKAVIKNFTGQANFNLETALIDKLVEDLAAELGEVRPIELQLVGAQLQAEKITTLAQYQRAGPKAKLVQRFLEQVIKDCGSENEQAARFVLYLLTDENGTRPFKNREELARGLAELEEPEKLDLVLEILVQSGLVFLLPEVQAERYQLVHDYLVAFIRQQHNLLAKLEQQKQELQHKQAEIQQLRKFRWFLGAAVAVGIIFALLATWAERQRQRAITNEIKAHAISSEALFAVNKPFDALLESLKAGRQLKQAPWTKADKIAAEVVTALQQTVYNTQERNRLEGHKSDVIRVSFSPDGKLVASASSDGTLKLWRLDGRLLETLEGHKEVVNSVSFSADGQTIASASADGTVKLWNLDGSLRKTLKGHQAAVLSVSFSPNGQTVASTSADKTLRLWNRDGSLRASLPAKAAAIRDLSFSPDGNILALASLDGKVNLWSLDGTLIKTLEGHSDRVIGVSFSPDGQTIASASLDDTVKLWNRDGQLLKTLTGHEDDVMGVSFSPDGQMIASASKDGTIKLWSRDGNLLSTLQGHEYWVYSVSFSPDSETLASASGDRTVRLWSLHNLGPKTLKGHQGGVSHVSFSPDGKLIASASEDKSIKLWQSDGKLLSTFLHEQPVWSVAFSPKGETIASASADHTVKLWQKDGALLLTLQGHSDTVLSVSFSPDGEIIASTSRDKTIKLWSRNGKLLNTLEGHSEPVNRVNFSPDGQMIASASDDKTVKLWTREGKLLRSLSGHQGQVNWVGFSPDGQTIASASRDGTVKLWSLDGQELKTFDHQTDQVFSVSFSPDGNTLASGSRDGIVRLWNLDGTLQITLRGHHGSVNWVSFSPDGKLIASASNDKTVILWDLANLKRDDLLAQGCNQVRDYLKNNPNVETSDRTLCDKIYPQK